MRSFTPPKEGAGGGGGGLVFSGGFKDIMQYKFACIVRYGNTRKSFARVENYANFYTTA